MGLNWNATRYFIDSKDFASFSFAFNELENPKARRVWRAFPSLYFYFTRLKEILGQISPANVRSVGQTFSGP